MSRRTRKRKGAGFPPRVVLALLLTLIIAVALDRAGLLPESVASIVRDIQRQVVEELGGEAPLPTPEIGIGRGVDLVEARALLERIRVESEHARGYERNDWPHWLDADRNCLSAREEVLIAESLQPPALGADGCDVVEGRWRDAFTGETFTDPALLDIDHMVPLQEAHQSGGYVWDRNRRATYANDLEDPRSLIAVSREANRAKSARGPEEWLPPKTGYRCRYVADWIAIKARWTLSMDESERATVDNILRECESNIALKSASEYGTRAAD